MSYIGNVPTTASFPFDQFSGTGSQTAFTLSQAPASTSSILVVVSGVTQNPNTYSVSGTTLTFTGAPPSGTNNIGVLFLGLPAIVGVPSAGVVTPAMLSTGGPWWDANGYFNLGTTGVSAELYVLGNAAQNIATLTDAATIAVDMGTANNFSVTLGGNRTLGNPTGLLAGQSGVIFITQDGTGSKTLAYSSFWDFSQGTAPTLTTTANAVDALVYTVRTSTAIVATLINNVG